MLLYLMPPLSLTSNYLQPHVLLTRSLVPRSPPKRHILGSLVHTISSLSLLHTILGYINQGVNFVHKHHSKNTEKAQMEFDGEYWEANQEEWNQKASNAEDRAWRRLIKENPSLFALGAIYYQPDSKMRESSRADLKKFNAEFYSAYIDPGWGGEKAMQKEDAVDVDGLEFEDIDVSEIHEGGED